MLVVGLVGRRAADEELCYRRRICRDVVGVVVIDLVVVPGHDPGEGGVCRLQVLVSLVQRITIAVLLERGRLPGLHDVAGASVEEVRDLVRTALEGDREALPVDRERGLGGHKSV